MAGRSFEVIGDCPVGGVEPGGIVTEDQLIPGTLVEHLLGVHLREVKSTVKADKTTEKAP